VEEFLPGNRSWWGRSRWWRVPAALAVTIVVTTCGIFWLAIAGHPHSERDPGASPTQRFSDEAAVFSASMLIENGKARL
jgi:hypothetical protein